jgi:uncharacterized phiE125 gp8 family phage protein
MIAYNAVIDIELSGGSSFIGDPLELLTVAKTSTQDQQSFNFTEFGNIFLIFVDGILYTRVTDITESKQYTVSGTMVTLSDPLDAGTDVIGFGSEPSATLVAQTEPVTLQQAKDWCRIDISDDDTLLNAIISASRARLERAANVSFITRTVKAQLNKGLDRIQLPYGPVNAIVSIKDSDDIDITDYTLKGTQFKWLCCDNEDVSIEYTAGYAVLPEHMREDLLNQIAWSYDNRGDAQLGSKISPNVKLTYRIP